MIFFFLQVCLKSYNVLLKRGARGAYFNSLYRLSVLVINKFIIVSENLFFNSMRNFSLFSTNQPVQQLRLPLFNVGKFYSVVFDEIVSIKFDLPEQVKWTLILSENTNVLLGPFITLKVKTSLFLHHKIHHFVICGQLIKLAARFLSHLFHCLLSARSRRYWAMNRQRSWHSWSNAHYSSLSTQKQWTMFYIWEEFHLFERFVECRPVVLCRVHTYTGSTVQ